MKRSVTVLLIVALSMIVVGLILCAIGGRIAANDRIDLFAYPESVEPDVTGIGSAVNRIIIDLKDADVCVIGGCEEQSVTFTGFGNIFHEVNVSGGTMTISGSPGWSTAIRVLTQGFSFEGLRFYTRASGERTERPTVTLSLSGDSIRNYNITLESGQLSVEKISHAADYIISIGQGSILMRDISGISDLSAKLKQGDVSLSVSNGLGQYNIITDHGNLSFDLPEDPSRLCSLVAVGGTVNYYGADRGGTMTFTPLSQTGKISARTGNGDITLFCSATETGSQSGE